MTQELLRIEGLNAWYGESHILHGVDLVVNEGEVVTLLGRNGAGRTTTRTCSSSAPRPCRPAAAPTARSLSSRSPCGRLRRWLPHCRISDCQSTDCWVMGDFVIA